MRIPAYHFFNTRRGVHFFTISEAERANVVANLPHFIHEVVGCHLLACDCRAAKLPHTSITSSQCYRPVATAW